MHRLDSFLHTVMIYHPTTCHIHTHKFSPVGQKHHTDWRIQGVISQVQAKVVSLSQLQVLEDSIQQHLAMIRLLQKRDRKKTQWVRIFFTQFPLREGETGRTALHEGL